MGSDLRAFNSYSRRVEQFEPLQPGRVGMYSCGLTVYSRGHLGNLRAYVFADTLRRTLLWQGYEVDHLVSAASTVRPSVERWSVRDRHTAHEPAPA